jgi:hypothetical protein
VQDNRAGVLALNGGIGGRWCRRLQEEPMTHTIRHRRATVSPAPRIGLPSLLAAGLLAGLALVATGPAQAAETTITGPKGKSATVERERERGTVETRITDEKGRTREREVERSKEAASAAVTRRTGETVTRETTRVEGGSTTELSSSKGKTATAETTRTETGSTTAVTGPDGQTKTIEHERGSLRDKIKAKREERESK